MQTLNVRRERQLAALADRAGSRWISRVSRLHPRRRLPALDEQLCRSITRPALANEKVQTNSAGQVVLKLKTP